MSQDRAGQGDIEVKMRIDGKWEYVYTTAQAAKSLGLKQSYITNMCDMGKLIATKVNGRWWIVDQEYKRMWIDPLPF